jgi:predicted O-methyltransferase YrrM
MSYDFTHDWFSMRTDPWREHVVPRLPRPFRWLEIGSHEGRSACWMLDEVMQPGDAITCVDVWGGPFDGYDAKGAESRFDTNVAGRAEKYKQRSHEFLARAIAEHRIYDGVYIDGDHHARIVLEDSVLAWRVLRVGGVVVWDDYRWQRENVVPPAPAIDAFLDIYGSRAEVLYRDWQVIAVKKGE